MPGLTSDVGMEECNRIDVTQSPPERPGQVVGDALLRVADSGNARNFPSVADHRLCGHVTVEGQNVRRHLELAAPAVERVVVAVNDECAYVAIFQAFHLAAKFDKGTQASVARVVQIAGKKDEVRFGVDRVRDDTIQRLKRR